MRGRNEYRRVLTSMSPSERRKYLNDVIARIHTALVYARAMKACGRRNIVRRPLSATWEHICLGDDCRIGSGCRIEGVAGHGGRRYAPVIRFGDRVSLEQRCTIVAAATLDIGRDTTVSYDVMITDVDHEYEALGVHVLRQPIRVRATSIGENCFIGAGAKILAGTRLGRQCVVGANAVVRGDFPDYSVLIGNPARLVRHYDIEQGRWRRAGGEQAR